MASKTSKWMTVPASAVISVMMGGAAFAPPAGAFEANGTEGLRPDLTNEAVRAGLTAASEAQRQVRQVTDTLRSTDGGSDLISKALGKVASNVGTKVADGKGQARRVLRQAS